MFIVIAMFLLVILGAYIFTLNEKPVEYLKDVETSNNFKTSIAKEKQFQRKLHRMTHQKVKADIKWGSEEITDKHINELLNELKQTDYKHKDRYREILKNWKKGNFSNAVEVHNAMWEIDEGTTGRAERLLTKEEEESYIKENAE